MFRFFGSLELSAVFQFISFHTLNINILHKDSHLLFGFCGYVCLNVYFWMFIEQ